ncbi:MAG: 50S ribosomal protein L6 [Endomicrobiaceae bacterium]|nr:50S ribosomal protein L6 [Endomicrobiaceae bacterium]MDD3053703.1 50S ribosomal protein L6 [Endomicrobiaceae bacterium]MDD3922714.1 50S ribosomal protein L6 [Endomicrobiaceae bacterium]MDD5102528.1 50S ribosomal protein L6 [Endomicrobiaceae bacterium]
MSRLGKKPITIPEKVKAEFKNGILEVSGTAGKLSQVIHEKIKVTLDKASVLLEKVDDSREANMLQGLTRGLICNMIEGVVNGYKKELELNGLGFKAVLEGKKITMAVGYSHNVVKYVPDGIKVVVGMTTDKIPTLTITGIDKQAVGSFAAEIRASKPPEPYKGFGIRYAGEKIIRKAGKAAASSKK